MADQDSLKKQRTSSKQRFTRAYNILTPLVTETGGNLVEIEKAFDDFANAWNRVEERHDNYTEALDEEDPANDAWIAAEQEKYNSPRKKYFDHKANLEKLGKLEEAKHSRMILEGEFDEHCSLIDKLVSSKHSTESIIREKCSLERKYDKLCSEHLKVKLLTGDEVDTDVKWKIAKYDKYVKMNNTIDSYVNEVKLNNSKTVQKINIKKLGLPSFNGNVRDYMRFIKDFKTLVLPSVSPEQSAFALRQCLTSCVKTYLGNDDDINSMLKTLDQRYGDPGKLVESVVGDVQRFKKIDDGDTKKLIHRIHKCNRSRISRFEKC